MYHSMLGNRIQSRCKTCAPPYSELPVQAPPHTHTLWRCSTVEKWKETHASSQATVAGGLSEEMDNVCLMTKPILA